MLTFLLKVEGQPDKKIEVSESPVIAGSKAGLPIVIPDRAADPRHVEISVRAVGVVLKDLATAKGTRVNGDLVSQVRLTVGDVIGIGGAKLVLTLIGATTQPEAAPAGQPRASKRVPVAAPSRAEISRERKKSRAIPILFLALLLLGGGAAVFILTRKPPEKVEVAKTDPARAPATGTATADAEPSADDIPDEPVAEPTVEPEKLPEPARIADEGPKAPDPTAAAAAAAEAKRRHEDLLRRKREATRVREVGERYTRFRDTLDERIARYAFNGPIADIVRIAEPMPVGVMRGEALGLQADLMRAKAVFDRVKEILASGKRRKITLSSGLTLTILSADDEGITAKVGPAQTKKRWTELDPKTIHDVVALETKDGEDWMDLSAFAALFDLAASEGDLAEAFTADERLREDIEKVLARRRAEAVPEGGYVLHEGSFITPVEKDYLERGYVKHEGKWLTRDEWMKARGYVKHEGKWLSPERYARILEAQKRVEELASKYLPKGLIDKPGNGAFKPWLSATSKAPVELKTRHYKIKTNLGRDVANDLAYTMEILNANLKAQFGIRGKGARFTINLCATRDQYRGLWRAAGGSLGFCSSNAICTFYQPPMTTAVLMHEGTHQILRKFASSAPRWLHEGVACYFECSRFVFNERRRRVELEVGLLNALRCAGCQAQIRSNRVAHLRDFIRGKGGDPYQQGWAFIYYLAKGKDGQYAPKLHTFIQEAHKKDVVERFQKIFRVKDMDDFDREWREWVLALDPRKGVRMDSAHR